MAFITWLIKYRVREAKYDMGSMVALHCGIFSPYVQLPIGIFLPILILLTMPDKSILKKNIKKVSDLAP